MAKRLLFASLCFAVFFSAGFSVAAEKERAPAINESDVLVKAFLREAAFLKTFSVHSPSQFPGTGKQRDAGQAGGQAKPAVPSAGGNL